MKRFILYVCFCMLGSVALYGQAIKIHPTTTHQLNKQEQVALQEKAKEMVDLFQDYCRMIAEKGGSQTLKSEYIRAAVDLFDSPERMIEVSSLNNASQKRSIRTYLNRLKNLTYTQVKIVSGNILMTNHFEYSEQKSLQTGEDWYEGIVTVTQQFTGERFEKAVYVDTTIRKIKVYVKKADIWIDGVKNNSWIIKLGDIQVLETK